MKKDLSFGPYLYLYEAMRKLSGMECYRFECHGDSSLFGKADLHVESDWSPELHGVGEFQLPHPSLYWCWDHHLSEDSFAVRVAHAKNMDYVCSVHPNRERLQLACGRPVTWLWQAAEPTLWKPVVEVEEKYDTGFIGTFTRNDDRINALDTLCRAFPSSLVTLGWWAEEGVRQLHEFRVAFNYSAYPIETGGTNLRTFEVMSAGRALVTNWTSDLKSLGFESGEHLLAYRTLDEGMDMIRWLLDHPGERARMGLAARKKIIESHTYVHRAIEILSMFGKEVRLAPMDVAELATTDSFNIPQRPTKDLKRPAVVFDRQL